MRVRTERTAERRSLRSEPPIPTRALPQPDERDDERNPREHGDPGPGWLRRKPVDRPLAHGREDGHAGHEADVRQELAVLELQ